MSNRILSSDKSAMVRMIENAADEAKKILHEQQLKLQPYIGDSPTFEIKVRAEHAPQLSFVKQDRHYRDSDNDALPSELVAPVKRAEKALVRLAAALKAFRDKNRAKCQAVDQHINEIRNDIESKTVAFATEIHLTNDADAIRKMVRGFPTPTQVRSMVLSKMK